MPAARSRQGRSTSRGEASREHILQAAVDVLGERGYSGLSISAICKKADIAATSIYWHFGNKAGLMEAVIRRTGGDHVEKIRASVTQTGDPFDQLDRLLAGIRELVLTRPLGSLTGVAVLSEGRHVSTELREVLRSAGSHELDTIATDFEAQLGRSLPYAQSLAVIVTACSNYAALTYQIDRDEAEVDRVLDALRDAIIRMVGPDALHGNSANE